MHKQPANKILAAQRHRLYYPVTTLPQNHFTAKLVLDGVAPILITGKHNFSLLDFKNTDNVRVLIVSDYTNTGEPLYTHEIFAK